MYIKKDGVIYFTSSSFIGLMSVILSFPNSFIKSFITPFTSDSFIFLALLILVVVNGLP